MTMTDTEAKALALVHEFRLSRDIDIHEARTYISFKALCRAIEREAATEARHAAELRELKERFSEAALFVDSVLQSRAFSKSGPTRSRLAPFILPAPDPLVEAIRSAMPKALVAHDTYDAIVLDVAAAVRKIGEAK